MIVKSLLSLLCLLVSTNLLSQSPDSVESKIKFHGIYGLSHFVKPHEEVQYTRNSLTLKFDSLNTFKVSAGNTGYGEYFIGKGNSIIFKNCITTVSKILVIHKSGYEYSADLFLDSLYQCNRFLLEDKEIRFYKDSVYKLALKPFHDLLPFPTREYFVRGNVRELGVDTIFKIKDFVVINSQSQKDSLGLNIQAGYVDFEKSSLLVIENKSLKGK